MVSFAGEYDLDALGRRVLRGLTYSETVDFETLDASLPYGGQHVWPDGLPLLPMEQRWLELWRKQRAVALRKA